MSSINFTGLSNIKVGGTDCTVYLGANKMWPTGISPTFAVVDDITAYTDTTYVDVYDKKTSSWYKLNDLNVYEKYGIYEKVTSLDRAETSIVKRCEVDLNNQWRESTYWSKTDYTCYESNSNYNVNNGYSSMKVIIPEGISSVTVYFGSNGESSYDYSVLWQLDKNVPTSNPDDTTSGVVASSKGKQGTKIEYTYTISDTSKSHFFWITYRKDSSNHSGTDRGYLLIKQVTTGTTVYPGKLVIYNNDEYEWNDNQWMRLGSITNSVYPLQYPEKDTPPALISFNSVEERDAYTQVYNGLLCKVGSDYYKYIDGNWIDYTPKFMVNNTQYNNGKWVLDSDINSNRTYNVKSDFDFDIHCEWYRYTPGDKVYLYVNNKLVAQSSESSTPIDYSLKAGTYVIELSTYKSNSWSWDTTRFLKDITYMKVKQ